MANIPTVSWSESTPAGNESRSLGDNRIRELKSQLREVIAVDHNMESSGQDTDWGYHNTVTLLEAADIGTGTTGIPILGAQTADGKAELVFTDEDDNDVQLTSGGNLGSATTNALFNNVTLSGTFAMDGGIVIESVLDEDDMTSDSAVALSTQQSIKAYTDGAIAPSDIRIKAWASIDGTAGSVSINDHYNIASVTEVSTGVYDIAWDTDFAGTSYVCVGSAGSGSKHYVEFSNVAAGSIRASGFNESGLAKALTPLMIIAIGDQ